MINKYDLPSNLNNLKSKIDTLGIEKLEVTPVDLSKLSNVIKRIMFFKKVYIMLSSKILNLATKTLLNAKINEIKGEIPSITNLATTTALTAVENKIPIVSNLVKKSDISTNLQTLLILILALKQQFIKCTSIKCNSTEHINGKYQAN